MKWKLMMLMAVTAVLSSPLFAQGTQVATSSPKDWKPVFAGIGMAIASGLCGLGQGKAVAGSAEAMARNPGATTAIRGALILGLVLIESLALYTLVIIFAIN